MNINLLVNMQSGLKWSSQTKIMFAFMYSVNTGVFSLVCNIKQSHSSLTFVFGEMACSLSSSQSDRILKRESLCFWLVAQPKKGAVTPRHVFQLEFRNLLQIAPQTG